MTIEALLQSASEKLQALDFTNAAALYVQALENHPSNGAALIGLAMVYNHTGQSIKALEIMEKVITSLEQTTEEEKSTIGPATLAEIYAQTGLAFHQHGQNTQALAHYEQANSIFPSSELEKRINNLQLINQVSSPFELLIQQARHHHSKGQFDEAIKCYKAALQLNPDSDKAQHGLGNLLREQGQLQEALPLIQQAIIMQPGIAEYHNTLGMLFQQNREFDKAILFHRRALDIDPRYAAAFCNLGVALKNTGHIEDAIKAYQSALAINPNLAEAYNNLGNLLRFSGNLDQAKAYLEQALKIRPNYPDAQRNLQELLAVEKPSTQANKAKPAAKKTSPSKPKTTTTKTKKTTPSKK